MEESYPKSVLVQWNRKLVPY